MIKKVTLSIILFFSLLSYSFADVNDDMIDAAFEDNFAGVKVALKNGAYINAHHSRHGATVIMMAAQNGNMKMLKYAIEQGGIIEAQDIKGDTALTRACCCDANLEIIKYLVLKGADVNNQGQSGFTPLMRAAMEGRVKVIKLLIQLGAIVDATNDKGETAEVIAEKFRHKDAAKFLQTATDNN